MPTLAAEGIIPTQGQISIEILNDVQKF